MVEQSRINKSNLKKIHRFNLGNRVYKSKKTNSDEGYQKTYGLKTSDDARKVLGKEGIKAIGSEITTDTNKAGVEGIKVSGAAVSTGGGDPLPAGSKDNEFLVAENAEEAEELRERTDGEVPVRTLQYRNSKGQFSDGVDKVQRKLKENAGEDSREYFKRKAGLGDEEFEKRIKSLGMTKDDFVYESLNNINAVSKGVVDKKALMHHLKYEKKLTDSQRARIYGDRKYGRKDINEFNKRFSDEQNEAGTIKLYQILNENKAKANDPSKRMKKYWRSRKQSETMKNKIAENEKMRQQQNEPQSGLNKAIAQGKADLSGYNPSEVAQVRKQLESQFGNVADSFVKQVLDERKSNGGK